jgi:hypothetical protein
MTTVRTVAVHDVVSATYPREVREPDRVAMAIGKAIDVTLSQVGHQARTGRRPTATSTQALAAQQLDLALEEGGVDLTPADRATSLTEIFDVARAFRKSAIFGLPRPRSHLLLIGADVGIYAQPDYWDGKSRFYEMKSYLAIPPRPDIALQLRLFQLAFPGLEAILVCIDRHARPVATTSAVIPPPTETEAAEGLRRAVEVARSSGRERVLEYVDVPLIRVADPGAGTVPTAARENENEGR